MIDFKHYIEFSDKFEDVLVKMEEDSDVFNIDSFGEMEKVLKKWSNYNNARINKDDLRIITTYLVCSFLDKENYHKEIRFLKEEIRLRNLKQFYNLLNPLCILITYVSHYIYNDPKKAFNEEIFLKNLISVIGKELNKENFLDILNNVKVKNFEEENVNTLLKILKSSTIL